MSGRKKKCLGIGQKYNSYVGLYFCLKILKLSICIIFSYMKYAIENYGFKVPRKCI